MEKLGLFTLILLISSCLAKNSYLVMFPKTIRPNLDLNVIVHLLDATNVPGTTVVASLLDDNNNTIVSERRMTDSVNSTLLSIPLKMPPSLPSGVTYAIKVQGEGGVNFNNYTKVFLNPKTHSVMIQTDKAIYKPGQTIHFRVFGIYPDISIVNENIDVEIYDPTGNKIAQWKNKVPDKGVFTDSLITSDHPVLGEWQIKAVQGNEAHTKIVTVDEYVLPKFDVTLDLPPYGLSNRSLTGIKVTSKYTFGKPVKGIVDIRIRSPYTDYLSTYQQLRKCQGYIDEIFHSAPINGEYKFDVEKTKLTTLMENLGYRLDYGSLAIEVNVTESITGLRQGASGTITFYPFENKLKFLNSLPFTFKPGLNYTVLGRLTRQDNSIVSLPTASRVKLTITQTLPLPSSSISSSNSTSDRLSELGLPPEITINNITKETTSIEPETDDLQQNNSTMDSPFVVETMESALDLDSISDFKTKTLIPVFLDIDASGFFKYEMTIPDKVAKIFLKAEYNGVFSYRSLQLSKSPSNNFMQVRLLNTDVKPKTGSISTFEIRTTEFTSKIYYQILSKGQVVILEDLDMQFSKLKKFNLSITQEMVPKARLLVYYIREEGEIVTDAISFDVDGIFENKVEIDFDVQETRPGKEVVVSVKADPDSTVHLLAVDKSVLILHSDNDIQESRVKDDVNSYDQDCSGYILGSCVRYGFGMLPMLSGAEDAYELFKQNGLAVLTDAIVYHYVEPRPVEMAALMMRSGRRVLHSTIGPETRVRRLFPETWLWLNKTLDADGMTSLSVPVPDTITTWVATAFAVNPKSGLGLTPTQANLKVFQPFFVSLTMPYLVTRGELVVLQANVFNYLNHDIRVLVIIDKNEAFKNIVTYVQDNQVKSGRFPTKIGRTFNMAPGEIYPVYFPIIPSEVGDFKINITATATGASDAIIRTLKVEPEGVEKEFNNPVLIKTGNSGIYSEDVAISFPPNTVNGSRRIRASVIGDLMGSSINGVDSLLRMPYGCGEQNMLNFAPNIFVQKYLTITNNLTPNLEKKAKEYMIKGYQRQMTYVHADGSYSAFGKSDASGSTWLTAFVVKSFSQALGFITIDENVVKKAVTWLVSQQNENGTFREPGRVLNNRMQGGSAAGERPLAAFSLIALKEAEIIKGVSKLTSKAIQKARTYLENDIDLMDDVYELALVRYALIISNSSRVNEVTNKLNDKANEKDGLKHWSKPETDNQWKGWAPLKDQAKAVDIETTAYALLGLAINKDLEGGLPVLKWITSQRNPGGGFASTQDTIVALQALAEFATMVYYPTLSMRVRLTSKTPGASFQHEFKVTQDNALILQTTDIPLEVKNLEVMAEGSGVALAEISTYFNINDDIEASSFDVNVTLTDETQKGFTVKICGRWLKEGHSGMSMMDIGIPSGMSPDLDTLDTSKAPMYKRNEMGHRKLSLYFDEFDSQAQCASVYMANTDKVAEKQPSVIRLYDYYEPKNQATTFYLSKVLAGSGLCDVCGRECFCADKQTSLINMAIDTLVQ